MCGSNDSQKQITDAQQKMYETLTANYNTAFQQSQDIVGALTSMFKPILAAGPSQTGFAAGQENALRTQADEGVATDYRQAQQATAKILAARGGGNTLLPSSVDANILANNANAAAAQRSSQNLGITQANYQQGYENWKTAAGVLGSTAGLVDPNSYGGTANTGGANASTSATQMAAQSNSVWNAAIGAVGSIGGQALGGYFGGGKK